MNSTTAHHQLGSFIVDFQHIESAIDEIFCLLTESADPETVSILINELTYSQRIKTVDVLFARFIDLRVGSCKADRAEFHKLIIKLGKLGERRNELVHSKYMNWLNVDGKSGLIRENSRLKGGLGIREQQEEELLPEDFYADLQNLREASKEIENFRLKLINYIYPDV